jgi:hypothetical protein
MTRSAALRPAIAHDFPGLTEGCFLGLLLDFSVKSTSAGTGFPIAGDHCSISQIHGTFS